MSAHDAGMSASFLQNCSSFHVKSNSHRGHNFVDLSIRNGHKEDAELLRPPERASQRDLYPRLHEQHHLHPSLEPGHHRLFCFRARWDATTIARILLASKRYYREAAGLFFTHTTFIIDHGAHATGWLNCQSPKVISWIKHIEAQVKISYGCRNGDEYLEWRRGLEKNIAMEKFREHPELGISESQVDVRLWTWDFDEALWPKDGSIQIMARPK